MSEEANNLMQDLKPTVWIGKQGCTETMIEEIVAQLKTRKMIKVKWLQSVEVDPEAIALQAPGETRADTGADHGACRQKDEHKKINPFFFDQTGIPPLGNI